MKLSLFAAGALALAAPYAAAQSSGGASNETARLEWAFKNWRYENLRDPDSILVRQTSGPRETTIVLKRGLLGSKTWTGLFGCYMMNAKNAYGAYTGYTPYAVMLTSDGKSVIFQGMGVAERGEAYRSWDQQVIDNYCSASS